MVSQTYNTIQSHTYNANKFIIIIVTIVSNHTVLKKYS